MPRPAKAVAAPAPRRALGRGLAALIPPEPKAAPNTAPAKSVPAVAETGFRTLAIERLRPNRGQPRKNFDAAALEELAQSIKVQGMLQPIIVRRQGDDYEIVAGERRWRAAGKAGLHEVPVMLKELSDVRAMQIALIENIQRSDLDPIEEAMAYRRLLDEHKLTHEELAKQVGKNRVTISNSMRLLKLSDPILQLLTDSKITAGHARALMMVDKEAHRLRLADDIVGRKMSVREAERKAQELQQQVEREQGRASGQPKQTRGQQEAIADITERLQRSFATKVQFQFVKNKGKIVIHFSSIAQLEGLLAKWEC